MKRKMLLIAAVGLLSAIPAMSGDKVTVCHRTGNDTNTNTITVGSDLVNSHLAHGDTLGSCEVLPIGG